MLLSAEGATYRCKVWVMFHALIILALLFSARALANESYRHQPCMTPDLAPTCIQVHARLSAGNGTPSTRLWPIGTHHIYGIYSNQYGFAHDGSTLDNESPQLPASVYKQIDKNGGWTVYGDFEVCPLEPLKRDHMQAACIASASHIVAPKE